MSENFDIPQESDLGKIDMSVSAICHTPNGERFAYVSFSDGIRTAEGKIPECKITFNKGFAAIEIEQLEQYMADNLSELKKMASGINIFEAFTK